MIPIVEERMDATEFRRVAVSMAWLTGPMVAELERGA